jgi:photosystem II stability/assembly factor-like uncharacterized protein
MSKMLSVAIILGAIFVMLPSAAMAQATPTEVKLLTQNTGWVVMRGHLYWTSDFGQDWRDITPPQAKVRGTDAIACVFFLDTSTGWVLLRRSDLGGRYGDWIFDLASTDDGGSSWSITPVQLANWDSKAYTIGGSGTLDFVDPAHGWMDLSLQSGPATDWGMLFVTNDGGRTWEAPPATRSAPGVYGSLRFLSTQVGWLAGGPGDSDLFVTRDGCKSWQMVTPNPPPQVGTLFGPQVADAGIGAGSPVVSPLYRLPVFVDLENGFLPVTYFDSRGGPENVKLVVYGTSDGGGTWSPVKVLRAAQQGTAGSAIPTSIVNSMLYVPVPGGRGGVATAAVSLRKAAVSALATIPTLTGARWLDFADPDYGWALRGGLYATSDGGRTWADITPRPAAVAPRRVGAPSSPAVQTLSGEYLAGTGSGGSDVQTLASAGGQTYGGLHTSAHLGFDADTASGPSDMATWWKYSPYYDIFVYLYLSGAEETHGDPSITGGTGGWVSQVENDGWGIVPIWDGPQAPCACRPNTGTYPNCTTFT